MLDQGGGRGYTTMSSLIMLMRKTRLQNKTASRFSDLGFGEVRRSRIAILAASFLLASDFDCRYLKLTCPLSNCLA